MTRPRPRAANEYVVPVSQFAPDRTGAAMFAAISSNIANGINGARAVVDTRGGTHFGWVRELQKFRGAAALGRGRPVVKKHGTIADERSAPQSTARAIFGEQMGRGR
jgi:hypothetical protein